MRPVAADLVEHSVLDGGLLQQDDACLRWIQAAGVVPRRVVEARRRSTEAAAVQPQHEPILVLEEDALQLRVRRFAGPAAIARRKRQVLHAQTHRRLQGLGGTSQAELRLQPARVQHVQAAAAAQNDTQLIGVADVVWKVLAGDLECEDEVLEEGTRRCMEIVIVARELAQRGFCCGLHATVVPFREHGDARIVLRLAGIEKGKQLVLESFRRLETQAKHVAHTRQTLLHRTFPRALAHRSKSICNNGMFASPASALSGASVRLGAATEARLRRGGRSPLVQYCKTCTSGRRLVHRGRLANNARRRGPAGCA